MNDSRIEKYEEQLRSARVSAQLEAIKQLALLAGPEAEAALIRALEHGDEWVVAEAVRALGHRKVGAAVAALLVLLKAESYFAQLDRLRMSWTDEESGEHAGVALAQYATDIEFLQEMAVAALEQIGTEEALEGLRAWRAACS